MVMWVIVAVAAAVVLVSATWPIRARNRLVSMRTTVVESWRGVDVELARRWELIPQLVSVAKAFAAHEATTLADLVARRGGGTPLSSDGGVAFGELREHVVADEARDDTELSRALTQLRGVAEAYPRLQSSQHYLEVLANLRDAQDRIAAAQRLYNGNVARYNAALQSFPASAVARRAGLAAAEFFEVDADKRALPTLEL